jgi:hypothetical protein
MLRIFIALKFHRLDRVHVIGARLSRYPICCKHRVACTIRAIITNGSFTDSVAKLVFWNNIVTIIDDINVALQSKRELLCATKVMEGLMIM